MLSSLVALWVVSAPVNFDLGLDAISLSEGRYLFSASVRLDAKKDPTRAEIDSFMARAAQAVCAGNYVIEGKVDKDPSSPPVPNDPESPIQTKEVWPLWIIKCGSDQ